MPEPKSDHVTSKLTYEDKYQAAKTAVALDKFVEKYNLTASVEKENQSGLQRLYGYCL